MAVFESELIPVRPPTWLMLVTLPVAKLEMIVPPLLPTRPPALCWAADTVTAA